jgi:hypothetical protein
MSYWPSKRNPLPEFDPTTPQWVVRWYTIPHGWFTAGPFSSFDEANDWLEHEDFAISDDGVEVKRATKGSPWKSMIKP